LAKKKISDLFEEDRATKPQNEFEALLNSSGVVARGLTAGDRFRGEVLAVSGQEAFISTGSPVDAVMPLGGSEAPKVGDLLDVIVVRARDGEIFVKKVGGSGSGMETDSLEDAYDMEIPVEGVVLEAVKGGFRVKVMGQKAFCPISQMDWKVTAAEEYVGRKFEFIITKLERGRDLVVSRRQLLAQERAGKEGEFLQSAEVGTIFNGEITRIEKYGAFIRLENGIEGLIPVSELSWGRISHPDTVVNLHQTVQAKLIRLEEDGDRLKVTFSLKQGGGTVDPWTLVETEYPVGTQLEGTVEHKEPYGLFVRLTDGLTGLLPRSAWRDAVDGQQYENKRKGDPARVRIERIDLGARKISLSVPRDDEDDSWRGHASSQAMSSGAKSMGTLGDLLKNVKINK
jgi:small subunit ribosomal protein S1